MLTSFRSKSFALGIVISSLMWLTVGYLYFTLTEESSKLNTGSSYGEKIYDSKFSKRASPNDIPSPYEKSQEKYENVKEYRFKAKPARKPTKKIVEDSFHLADLALVKTAEDKEIKEKGYQDHAFNTLISSRLSYHRSIPDTRHQRCKSVRYPNDLPSLSIVICFYREDMPTLLRTLHSIFDRTPEHLLKEVILVDDTDDGTYHEEMLKNVKPVSSKIIVMKTSKREGLIRARVLGTRKTTGEVLLFLDSHIEVNTVWAEPLLARIADNRTRVVTPIIDVINADTFKYSASTLVRGGFNWGLFFKWDNIPSIYFSNKENFINPIRHNAEVYFDVLTSLQDRSPTMAGGLFAIDRKYFQRLGEYDTGMDVWGGENLEISFRIWMCGGTLEIMPCSRVGHIFRKRRPYGDFSGGDSLTRNSLRVASVWMDQYKAKFLEVQPEAANVNYGDVSDRIKLRHDLKCKSFQWYLDNVYPEILNGTSDVMNGKKFERWDQKSRNYLDDIQIRLSGSDLCVESEDNIDVRGCKFILSNCASLPRQIFSHTDKDELVLSKLLCLQASSKMPHLGKCHEMGGDQEWRIQKKNGIALYNIASGLCLAALEKRNGAYLTMSLCSNPEFAKWDIISS